MKNNKAFRNANRDTVLENSEVDEILVYLEHQIESPFDINVNYLKKLRNKATSEEMEGYYEQTLGIIEDTYTKGSSGIKFDINLMTDLGDSAYSIYRFFVKNIRKITFIFLREYLSVNKIRKNLIAPYLENGVDSYPKEQYGKKENYILMQKLGSIIKDIKNSGISLIDFIGYVDRANDSASYIKTITDLINKEAIVDDDCVSVILHHFIKCDDYSNVLSKLSIHFVNTIIIPCLEEMGYGDLGLTFIKEEEPEIISDRDDEE